MARSAAKPGPRPYMMKPRLRRFFDGGDLMLGPIQFNWGYGNGQMPRGLRVHLTWPFARARSLYLFGKAAA